MPPISFVKRKRMKPVAMIAKNARKSPLNNAGKGPQNKVVQENPA